jgi:hypothetical protein
VARQSGRGGSRAIGPCSGSRPRHGRLKGLADDNEDWDIHCHPKGRGCRPDVNGGWRTCRNAAHGHRAVRACSCAWDGTLEKEPPVLKRFPDKLFAFICLLWNASAEANIEKLTAGRRWSDGRNEIAGTDRLQSPHYDPVSNALPNSSPSSTSMPGTRRERPAHPPAGDVTRIPLPLPGVSTRA